MTRLVLNKNPEQNSTEITFDIKKIIEQNTINFIMCSDPFLKTLFYTKIISLINTPVIYLDFDLLYSGYVISETIHLPQNVTLIQPTQDDWNEIIKKVILRLSEEKTILIIDSLNGFFNMFYENTYAGRLVNSYLMFFACISKITNSQIFLGSLAKQKKDEGWFLETTGRYIPDFKKTNKIHLQKQNSSFLLDVLDTNNIKKNSFLIPIKSEIC